MQSPNNNQINSKSNRDNLFKNCHIQNSNKKYVHVIGENKYTEKRTQTTNHKRKRNMVIEPEY